jgi:hypothetical protein
VSRSSSRGTSSRGTPARAGVVDQAGDRVEQHICRERGVDPLVPVLLDGLFDVDLGTANLLVLVLVLGDRVAGGVDESVVGPLRRLDRTRLADDKSLDLIRGQLRLGFEQQRDLARDDPGGH